MHEVVRDFFVGAREERERSSMSLDAKKLSSLHYNVVIALLGDAAVASARGNDEVVS